MTLENRFVASLDDICAVVLECVSEQCRAKLTCPPEKLNEVPNACPRCRRIWFPESGITLQEISDPSPVELVKTLARIRANSREPGLGFRVLLEFDAPK